MTRTLIAFARAQALAVSMLFAAAASATSYVPMTDGDLARQASVIARVTVEAVQPGPLDRSPVTDYVVSVESLLQGYLPAGTVVVRVPGGERVDGLNLKIAGAPVFAPGEQALLFLDPLGDGTYGIEQLMLGAFHIRHQGARELAEQDLAAAHRLGGDERAEDASSSRDAHRFATWLTDRAAGRERTADYWVSRPEGRARVQTAAATDEAPARWFGFEKGATAAWRVHTSGQSGLDLAQTVAAAQTAIAAWSADPTSTVGYEYGGTTTATTGYGTPDKQNAFLFDDPNGQIPGSFDCKKGGVLAFGGSYFYASTSSYGGQSYHQILEADVVTNDGATCFFAGNPSGTAEVFTHELGHTLGFAHSASAQAVMYPQTHNDGRGARLEDDDRVRASVVYGDGSYQPQVAPEVGPFTITATATRNTVTVEWRSPFDGIEAYRVENKTKKGFQTLGTVAGDAHALTVNSLRPKQALTLRVVALRPGGEVAGTSDLISVRTLK